MIKLIFLRGRTCRTFRRFIHRETVKAFSPKIREGIIFEQTTPIVFLSGEGLSLNIWDGCADLLAARGYSGLKMQLPANMSNVDEMVDSINNEFVKNKITPPIMITHSFSTLIGQRYLESYGLKGLVMINPLPPKPINALNRLYKNCNIIRSEHGLELYLNTYYTKLFSAKELELFQSNFSHDDSTIIAIRKMIIENNFSIVIEPKSTDILVIYSRADAYLTDDEKSSLIITHGLQPDLNIFTIDDGSRCPFFCEQKLKEIDNILDPWLDTVF